VNDNRLPGVALRAPPVAERLRERAGTSIRIGNRKLWFVCARTTRTSDRADVGASRERNRLAADPIQSIRRAKGKCQALISC